MGRLQQEYQLRDVWKLGSSSWLKPSQVGNKDEMKGKYGRI